MEVGLTGKIEFEFALCAKWLNLMMKKKDYFYESNIILICLTSSRITITYNNVEFKCFSSNKYIARMILVIEWVNACEQSLSFILGGIFLLNSSVFSELCH